VLCAEDVIRLTNGQQLRGKIIEETDEYVTLKSKHGVQEISRDEIESIERGFDFDGEFKQKASGLGPRDTKGWYELGVWCEDNKQLEKAGKCYHKAIEIDPENEPARDKLGHKKYQDKWYETDEEYYKARGWVSYYGEWMPKDNVDKYKAGLVKRDDGTWVSRKVWDVEEKKRRAARLKKKEQERKEKEAKGEKVEDDPGKDESGDAGAAIRRKSGAFGRKNPVPEDKKKRKEWIKSYKQKLGWKNHCESKHYIFMSNAPADKVKYYAQLMDKMYKQYCTIFAYKEKQYQPFLVHMYANQKEFMAKDRKGPGVGGYYEGSKIVCFHGRAGSLSTQTVLFHEGTHQFQGLIWPDMGRLTRVQGGIWMVEGLATYFECAQLSGKKILTGQVNKGRFGTLRGAMAKNRYAKLKDLIRMTQRGYSAYHYAHGWGLCYFLIHADSKLRSKFKKYFKEFKKEGVEPVAKFKEIFPYDEEKLDEEWVNYIRNLRR
jgi:tetratricopeptide (TPR) repeat protein